jgi:SAM-dependent methyltransferase
MFAFLSRWWSRLRSADPVVTEWEWYARHHLKERGGDFARGAPLGDEWNRPEVVGADVPAEELVAHVVRTVIAPHLASAGEIGTLLEIGAGGGRFTAELVPLARRIIAADTAPTMVGILEQRFAEQPKVEPLLLDGRGLAEIPDASVDAAVSYDVFVHLSPWSMGLYLMELARVLRPGAPAVIHHANTLSDLGWGRFVRDVERLKRGQRPDSRFTPMTPELFGAMAGRAGLFVERVVTDVVRRDAITLARMPRSNES